MTLKLKNYAMDGVLADVDDASWLAERKLKADTRVSFAGVERVTLEFLDTLFAQQEDLDALLERIDSTQLSDAVSATLDAWLTRREAAQPSRGGGSPRPDPLTAWTAPPQPEEREEATTVVAAPPAQGERYTPTRLFNTLRRQLRSYIESAYPLKEPALIHARRELLERGDGGRLLAQVPFIETTPRYPLSRSSYRDLGLPGRLGELLERLSQTPSEHGGGKTLLYPRFFEHQRRAFEASIRDGRDIIVATGTGSGKTECFLVPLLSQLLREAATRPEGYRRRAIRGLVLYPMNALVNDQLARLRLLLGDPAVRALFHELETRQPLFGMYTSRTRYPGPRNSAKDASRVAPLLEYYLTLSPMLERELRARGRYPAKDLERFMGAHLVEQAVYKSGKREGQTYNKHHWDKRLKTGPDDSELLTRQEMVRDPMSGEGGAPDVLVTNYSMLEYMLMRPFERPLFEETRAWLEADPESVFTLIIDEAHMYRGAQGAEVAFLIRRLLARLGLSGRPDKVRVICTSASLGSEEDALVAVRRFAADLTGKTPDDFEVITSRREVPAPVGPGEGALADALAQLDLERLHESSSPAETIEALRPVFAALSAPPPGAEVSEDEVFAALHQALDGLPVVNQALAETSGHAQALDALADTLFPEHPARLEATEVLLTLGTLARRAPGEPGLVPTRLHVMFRGLNGLSACVNPRCGGATPGSPVGKMFAAPRTRCDTCDARVFELASCRHCGTAFMRAFTQAEDLMALDYLWSEAEGDLQPLEFALREPQAVEICEEVKLQMETGFVVDGLGGAEATRSIWIARDHDGLRDHEFMCCPECQSPSLNETRRIETFRTRGEQPFTSLIEAQFIEQPPQQGPSRELPNQGRKVLVFSDGRQRAARLAPALETSHSRDAFRQVLALAAHGLAEIGREARLDLLYPAVLWVCNERTIQLFPEARPDTFQQHLRFAAGNDLVEIMNLAQMGYFEPPLPYARKLFTEVTDRFYSLWSLGLATVKENDVITSASLAQFPEGVLDPSAARVLLRHWIRTQLERRCFRPPGASRFALGDAIWERPQGLYQNKPSSVAPRRFDRYLNELLPDRAQRDAVVEWFTELSFRGFMTRVFDTSRYLSAQALVLQLRLDEDWLRCSSCNRLYVDHIRYICPNCAGRLEAADGVLLEARSGYYRDKVHRAMASQGLEPYGMTAMEHSAQLSSTDDSEAYALTEEYELRFQDIPIGEGAPIDVLSCTTTMEVGIDIGQLSAVALRNVPPHVSNYQQRAGRAGRRGTSIASVLTYAQGGTHDAYFFSNPARIISGAVRSPVVYVENQEILRRHAFAFLVQRYFHDAVEGDPKRAQLFESLGTVEQFLSDEEECSFARLKVWLESHRAQMTAELREWAPRFSYALDATVNVEEVVSTSIDRLLESLERELPFDLFARRDALTPAEQDVLNLRLEENLLQTLLDRGIFPRYAFPTDVVSLYVLKRDRNKWASPKRPEFVYQPSRDLQIALSEYAPGREITIDKKRFQSSALYSPYNASIASVLDSSSHYLSCEQCGYVEVQPHQVPHRACPVCENTALFRLPFIIPPGFAVDVNAPERADQGGSVQWAGQATRARLEVQNIATWDAELFAGRLRSVARPEHLVVVNKGLGDRGFMVCDVCGMAEPQYGHGHTRSKLFNKTGAPKHHKHPTQLGVTCQGHGQGPYFLGHRFLTDVLVMRLRFDAPFQCSVSTPAGQAALTTLAEALCLAASRVLQIEEGEIAGHWAPVPGEDGAQADVYIYDKLAGGAGYAREIGDPAQLTRIFSVAEGLLSGCGCASSCYDCLRSYQNQFYHSRLDRHLGLALIEHIIRDGRLPTFDASTRERLIKPVEALLELKEMGYERNVAPEVAPDIEVPLVVQSPNGLHIWIDIHHPFVPSSPEHSPVLQAAQLTMEIAVGLDAYTIEHNLPHINTTLQTLG